MGENFLWKKEVSPIPPFKETALSLIKPPPFRPALRGAEQENSLSAFLSGERENPFLSLWKERGSRIIHPNPTYTVSRIALASASISGSCP